MAVGVVGRKVGMTRIFSDAGEAVSVTVVAVEENRVVQVKSVEKDGYDAVVIACGEQKASRVNRPEAGLYVKTGVKPARCLFEFRIGAGQEFSIAQQVEVDQFETGQMVDVTGVSKGKGFQGGIKRHNFSSQDSTHGNSLSHRALGSTGQNQSPGKVFRGKKMPGRMGGRRLTVQNLRIVEMDVDRNLLCIQGAIPGCVGSDVIVRPAFKSPPSLS